MPNGNESPSPGASGLPARPSDWNGRLPAKLMDLILERPVRKRPLQAVYFDYHTAAPNVVVNLYDGHDGPKIGELIVTSAKAATLCWLEPKPHPDTPVDDPVCAGAESPAESPT